MKLLIIIAFLCVVSCRSNSQDISKDDLLKYKQAYNYIIGDTISLNKEIIVSDTIFFIERALFWEELKIQGEKPETTIARIDSVDQSRYFDGFYSLQLSKTFRKGISSNLNLYFSKIFNDGLVAEVIYNKGLIHASYNRITMFNTGYRYLFIFDINGLIKEVLVKEIQYN